MIQNFIQEQVDTLARTLQRSVAIDDVGINLVAVSKHFDDADDARVRAILARTLEEDSCQYLFSFGIVATRDKIVRIPECRELGFKERSCYPIRWQERTLGHPLARRQGQPGGGQGRRGLRRRAGRAHVQHAA